jgi:hypothetical protein
MTSEIEQKPKMIALRKALRELKIDHVIKKRDGNLIIINLWIGDDD